MPCYEYRILSADGTVMERGIYTLNNAKSLAHLYGDMTVQRRELDKLTWHDI